MKDETDISPPLPESVGKTSRQSARERPKARKIPGTTDRPRQTRQAMSPPPNRISPNNLGINHTHQQRTEKIIRRDTTILGNKTSDSQSTGPPSLSLAQNNQSCS
ncbi:hypothetical protein PCASD_26080 [Puccinia coronata f. sp. avenae]|uniref:Uncharacterized protein n=1 Tax=Puccinia coronata f. sp. avenae TaxID=200324 RepID=A0A2N5RVH8_9BASI|nr:hypothetical protein PCASD_26080 [Puccinia coronata f. sp. avenae]